MSVAWNATKSGSLIGIGLVGFALTAALIHGFFREPLRLYSEARSEKLYILDHTAGTVTAAAFGSSRIHDAFDPGTFDRELASAGHRVSSINLAIYGGSQTEQRAMAMEFLRRGSSGNRCGSCLILFEYNAGVNLQPENLMNPRVIDIYDLETARFAIAYSGAETTTPQRLGRAAYAAAGSFLHEVNLGMLSNAIFSPPLNGELLANYTADDRRGRAVDPPTIPGKMDVIHTFEKHPKPVAVPQPTAVPPGAYQLLADTSHANPGRDLRYIYYVSPLVGSLLQMEQLPCTIAGPSGPVPIFNFNRPDRYPVLFTPDMWHDALHLSDEGALVFSGLLAKEAAGWMNGISPQGCGG